MRDRGNHPHCRRYYLADEILVTAPAAYGRSPFFYSCAASSLNPFVVATARCIETAYALQPAQETLKQYYALVQPPSAQEFLGLPDRADSPFRKVPAWSFVWPWEPSSIEQKQAWQYAARREQALRNLGTADLAIRFGWKFAGPASDALISNEAMRLQRLALSVRDHGLQRHDGAHGDILAAALLDEQGEWRWSIISGHHRAAVLAASGYTELPVRISRVVSRADVRIWPNVLNGLYTPAEALTVFDKLYHAEPSAVFDKWTNAALEPGVMEPAIAPELRQLTS